VVHARLREVGSASRIVFDSRGHHGASLEPWTALDCIGRRWTAPDQPARVVHLDESRGSHCFPARTPRRRIAGPLSARRLLYRRFVMPIFRAVSAVVVAIAIEPLIELAARVVVAALGVDILGAFSLLARGLI